MFVNVPARFALVGDTLFQGSVGRTDFPYGNHEQLIAGIKDKLLPLGDDVTILPGHGPASTIGGSARRQRLPAKIDANLPLRGNNPLTGR